jgi:protoporphyrinogen oxidase
MEIDNSMQKVAVIGGGVSGLSVAQMLKSIFQVTVFEKENKPGGLIRCERLNGTLYHLVGGHVFNSKRKDVLDWFWNYFDQQNEFTKTPRNAAISLFDKMIGYPIENHLYELPSETTKRVIVELLERAKTKTTHLDNFEEFLQQMFGETLYKLYFKPYNEKIWRRSLKEVPLSWLEGKLPMPTVEDIMFNNIHHVEEKEMVHSSFYYAKNNGSQFIADRLAEGLTLRYNTCISSIVRDKNSWLVNGEPFDIVIFCGNVVFLSQMISGIDFGAFHRPINELQYHGTTSVLCEIQTNPYSWIYMPDDRHLSHRIICTGNFSETNNANGKLSGTIEFTDTISQEDILLNLRNIPLAPKYLAHHFTPYTYPIQGKDTREMISSLKNVFEPYNLFLLGRFAEWEYYNMDAAIGAAMSLSQTIKAKYAL